ncbi:CBS domain-containing protein [Sulfurivirga caldicuralii]|uniref:CBS domain-containing protein n=1 Tax=Sulfurivirga caldicuralii TaxID=364032 RepID=A0A1N6E6H9_9GAMM|nr:nucleotidyltransferase family protein [Sulfurivirga caldicuralii]SIN78601.1 CBS domain-containing protein [Sulfurivirga caldicuralii]
MSSKDWKKACMDEQTPLKRAIRIIDSAALQIGLVTDAAGRLKGVVTDGDIRRALLKPDTTWDMPIRAVMNPNPAVVKPAISPAQARARMQKRSLRHLPIVDDSGTLVGLHTWDETVTQRKDNWVVLMAGGFGTRLRPLTDETPKPLLPVGNKPILEHILESFIEAGFYKFFISVHYKAEMIKRHFGDGSEWGVQIQYLEESEPLGTAGCLNLLPEKPDKPLILMNGDLLTKVDFERLLEFHESEQAFATLCVREYTQQVPYGVIDADGSRLQQIVEKPVQRYFVNAGIYVMSPEFVRALPKGRSDVPDHLQSAAELQRNVTIFPIHEYWLDIGRMDDFQRAQDEYLRQFA